MTKISFFNSRFRNYFIHIFTRFAVQILNLVISLVLLRFIEKEVYGVYTVINISSASLASLSALNIVELITGMMARELDQSINIFRAAYVISNKFFLIFSPVILIGTAFLIKNKVDNIEVILLILLLMSLSSLNISLLTSILNVNQRAITIFFGELISTVTRIIILCAFIFQGVNLDLNKNYTGLALITLLVMNLSGNLAKYIFLRVRTSDYIDKSSFILKEHYITIKKFAFGVIFSNIYYISQSQISIVLLSVYSKGSNELANIGAISTFHIFFATLQMLNGFITIPLFSRLSSYKFKLYATIVMIVGIPAIFFVTIFSHTYVNQLLLLLGNKYKNLQVEFMLQILSSQIWFFGTVIQSILYSKACSKGQYLVVILSIFGQLIYLSLIEVDNSKKSLMLNLLLMSIFAMVQIFLLLRFLIVKNSKERPLHSLSADNLI